MKLLKCLFKKKKSMGEIKKGDKVKLRFAPSGKPTSNNTNINSGGTYVIGNQHDTGNIYKAYYITHVAGANAGWVYEYEIVGPETKEDIAKQIDELQSEIDCLKSKLGWMNDVGVDEYDEDEFKVYETLKTLQDNDLDLKAKTKLIASLIKGGNC
jgi:hypothetical protein